MQQSTALGEAFQKCYKWKDSKNVFFISNYHGTDETFVGRKDKNGRKQVVSCPDVVKDYNAHMGGVDKHDQLRQYYNVERKSIKWWHRIAFGLLDMAVVNAFLMYQEIGHDSISLFEFRRSLALGL